jgi:hypothetical protein
MGIVVDTKGFGAMNGSDYFESGILVVDVAAALTIGYYGLRFVVEVYHANTQSDANVRGSETCKT